MNLYDFDNYKKALKAFMSHRRQIFGGKFTFEKMAIHCGVQKTYLSKVMNSHAHLNPDQLFSACEYLKMSLDEIEFLLLLRESEIALNAKRGDLLNKKIDKIRIDKLKITSEIQSHSMESIGPHRWEYFTNIELQLIHLFLTIPQYSKNPELICAKIGIEQNRLFLLINKLKDWNLVQSKNNEYLTTDPNLHLPEDSPVFQIFSILNRIKTIEKIKQTKLDSTEDYFFSVIFSSELKFQNILKKKLLDFIKQTQTEVLKQKSEQVYQLNIDFFSWG